jgi:hypothetical protein
MNDVDSGSSSLGINNPAHELRKQRGEELYAAIRQQHPWGVARLRSNSLLRIVVRIGCQGILRVIRAIRAMRGSMFLPVGLSKIA